MKRILLLTILATLLGAPVFAVKLGSGGPKITIYRPNDSSVVVYDARPELGIGISNMTPSARQSAMDIGIRLVRHTIVWSLMEPTEKESLYDSQYLAHIDSIVEQCGKDGIYLEMAVRADATGVSYANRQQAYDRFAKFMADMAKRYPSVLYWEPLSMADNDSTCLFGARDGASMLERGKNYAEMMKRVYPAIKIANPAASVLCGSINDTGDFVRGLYEAGGNKYIDIMNIRTTGAPAATAFVARAKEIRAIMTEHGDETKPLWNTGFGFSAGDLIAASGYPHDSKQDDAKTFDEKQREDIENCFKLNNDQKLYAKVFLYTLNARDLVNPKDEAATAVQLPEGMVIDDYGFGLLRVDGTPRPAYKWLDDIQANAVLLDKPRTAVNVFLPGKLAIAPIGYDYIEVEGGIQIRNVVVDTLVPTCINLMPVASYSPTKPDATPGAKPAPRKNKSTRPIPDPFDI